MKISAVVLGGGRGTRLGLALPKQFIKLQDRPLFDYSVEKFLALKIDFIVAVLVTDFQKYYSPHPAISAIAPGGNTRQESVFNGLHICPEDTELVIVHDSARPFFPLKKVEQALKLLSDKLYDGLALALPATDTLAEAQEGKVISFPDRRKIYHLQTPQLFHFKKILEAHRHLQGAGFTDDLSLAHSAGLRCGLIEGSPMNFKITSEVDWYLAERLLLSGGLEFI